MGRIGIIWLMIGSLLAASCRQGLCEQAMRHLMPVDSIEMEIGRLKDMTVHEGKLFVVDTKAIDGYVQVYDIATRQFLFSFPSDISVSFSDRYLYALRAGEPEDDEVGNYEREVHVFDIQTGEIVCKYLLDRPCIEIAVDADTGRLYALNDYDSPESLVLVYYISE